MPLVAASSPPRSLPLNVRGRGGGWGRGELSGSRSLREGRHRGGGTRTTSSSARKGTTRRQCGKVSADDSDEPEPRYGVRVPGDSVSRSSGAS